VEVVSGAEEAGGYLSSLCLINIAPKDGSLDAR